MGVDVSICIATYRRPKGLSRLLDSLERLKVPLGIRIETIVVDNDCDASAASIVKSRSESLQPIHYCVEPRRNIALARNCALSEASGRWVLFIDDDEAAEEHWISEHLMLVESAPCDGSFGPVLPRLEEAVTAFAKSHAATPDKGGLHFSLARVEQRRDDPKKALERLQVCFDEKTADEGTAPYKLLAELLESLDRRDELIERLEKLLADDPDNVPLGYSLAEKYLEADQVAEAEALYRKLVEKTPTVTGYRRLAEIYRKTKRAAALLAILGDVIDKTGLLETLGDEAKSIVDDEEVRQAVVEAARARQKTDADKLDFSTALAVALLALEAAQFETAAELAVLVSRCYPRGRGRERIDPATRTFQALRVAVNDQLKSL